MNRIFLFVFWNPCRANKLEKYFRNQKKWAVTVLLYRASSDSLAESLRWPAAHVQSGNWHSWDCKLAECWVCMCASICLQSWPRAHFVSQHQCALTSLSSVPRTRVCWGADTGHRHFIYSVNICTTLFSFLSFSFLGTVNYIVHLCMIEYDPEYHTSSTVDVLYIHTLQDHKSCVCTIWAVVVVSSSFHILLGSHRGSNLWCYCSSPFQCKQ